MSSAGGEHESTTESSGDPAPLGAPRRRACITGASGFIGGRLIAALEADGWSVSGIDAVARPGGNVEQADITRPGAWQQTVARCDLVIHTAALVTNSASQEAAWKVNVLGTRHVLDAAGGAARFVHLSSVRAFSDRHFPAGVSEHWPVRTDGSAYVDTKVASEQVVLQAAAAGEVHATIIRPGDVYGPWSRPWTVLPLEMISARRFVLPAWGRGVFSPIFVDDLVRGVLQASQHPAGDGHVFTLTGGAPVTCAEFFGHYAEMVGRRGVLRLPTPAAEVLAVIGGGLDRLGGNRASESSRETIRYLARTGGYSSVKARERLGFHPEVNLADGMRRVREWLASEPAGVQARLV